LNIKTWINRSAVGGTVTRDGNYIEDSAHLLHLRQFGIMRDYVSIKMRVAKSVCEKDGAYGAAGYYSIKFSLLV
jgi:hypothetical protein